VHNVRVHPGRDQLAEALVLAAVLGIDADPSVNRRSHEAFLPPLTRDLLRHLHHELAVVAAHLNRAKE